MAQVTQDFPIIYICCINIWAVFNRAQKLFRDIKRRSFCIIDKLLWLLINLRRISCWYFSIWLNLMLKLLLCKGTGPFLSCICIKALTHMAFTKIFHYWYVRRCYIAMAMVLTSDLYCIFYFSILTFDFSYDSANYFHCTLNHSYGFESFCKDLLFSYRQSPNFPLLIVIKCN